MAHCSGKSTCWTRKRAPAASRAFRSARHSGESRPASTAAGTRPTTGFVARMKAIGISPPTTCSATDAARSGSADQLGSRRKIREEGGRARLETSESERRARLRMRAQIFSTNGSCTSSESSHQTLFVCRYSSIASAPFARPMPLCLVAAEGRVEGDRAVQVDPHRAGLELPRHAVRARDVARPDAGREPEARAVGQRDRLRLVANGITVRTGPKTSSCAIGSSLPTPSGWSAGRRGRPGSRRRAARCAAADDLARRRRARRSTIGSPAASCGALAIGPICVASRHRVAEPDLAARAVHALQQLVVDLAPHERARAGDAGLAGGREDAGQHAGLGASIQVRVGEDDVRALAAELQRARAPGARRRAPRSRGPVASLPVNEILRDAGMVDQRLARLARRRSRR